MHEWIKNTVCPKTNSCTHTHTHTHTMEYYSSIKNKIMPFVVIRMDLEITILSDVSQKNKNHVILLINEI